MAIQISSNTVIDNSRNLTCVATACADQLGGNWIATQAEAEAGTDNTQVMTPLRVTQAITKLAGSKDSDINWTACNVGCAVRGGGNVIYKSGGIIWIAAPLTAEASGTWPTGYCSGVGGEAPNKAQRITGRSGWFVPDIGMLQTAYTCRAYWDTFANSYWSSTDFYGCKGFNISGGVTACSYKYNTGVPIRAVRVICY